MSLGNHLSILLQQHQPAVDAVDVGDEVALANAGIAILAAKVAIVDVVCVPVVIEVAVGVVTAGVFEVFYHP